MSCPLMMAIMISAKFSRLVDIIMLRHRNIILSSHVQPGDLYERSDKIHSHKRAFQS
ncbi:Hypothetical predicted protein [Xyrichtys novacula]|uniref:Uncharacterized protein n=1 Tax=Xyrichtys novacula TaxID=13765 RepID=A0AAV1GVU6_XYRNO|nr:Hypothetical predicted protein [Xyrichtys novacula]